MIILDSPRTKVNRKLIKAVVELCDFLKGESADKIAVSSYRVWCQDCGWRHELGSIARKHIGESRARAHHRLTGHRYIRFRFDLLNVDEGPVDLRTDAE